MYKKSVFPRQWFTELTKLPFEGRENPLSACYHEILTALYGDYMVPTPPENRGCKVHGEIVDLEHSYEEYKDIQKKLKFEEYSTCIR